MTRAAAGRYWSDPWSMHAPRPRGSDADPESEALCARYVSLTKELRSSTLAAEQLGTSRQSMWSLLKSHPDLLHEHKIINELNKSIRLAEDGRECVNGCGPVLVWAYCPECKRYCRPSRAKAATDGP